MSAPSATRTMLSLTLGFVPLFLGFCTTHRVEAKGQFIAVNRGICSPTCLQFQDSEGAAAEPEMVYKVVCSIFVTEVLVT